MRSKRWSDAEEGRGNRTVGWESASLLWQLSTVRDGSKMLSRMQSCNEIYRNMNGIRKEIEECCGDLLGEGFVEKQVSKDAVSLGHGELEVWSLIRGVELQNQFLVEVEGKFFFVHHRNPPS
jgi:hypothetical protein